MKRNSHLSLEEREKITILQAQGLSHRKIAKELNRNPSTISRELRRTVAIFFRGIYIGSQTHKKVSEYWKECHKRVNVFLNDNPYTEIDFVTLVKVLKDLVKKKKIKGSKMVFWILFSNLILPFYSKHNKPFHPTNNFSNSIYLHINYKSFQ